MADDTANTGWFREALLGDVPERIGRDPWKQAAVVLLVGAFAALTLIFAGPGADWPSVGGNPIGLLLIAWFFGRYVWSQRVLGAVRAVALGGAQLALVAGPFIVAKVLGVIVAPLVTGYPVTGAGIVALAACLVLAVLTWHHDRHETQVSFLGFVGGFALALGSTTQVLQGGVVTLVALVGIGAGVAILYASARALEREVSPGEAQPG